MGALKTWDGTAWQLAGVGGVILCTSGTRPSTPGAGQEIYETDTKQRLLWDGTAWVKTGQVFDDTTAFPVQMIAKGATTIAIGPSAGAALVVATGAFTTVVGALYRLTCFLHIHNSVGAEYTTIAFRTDTVSTGTTGTSVGTAIKDHRLAGRMEAVQATAQFTAISAAAIFAKVTGVSSAGGTSTYTGTVGTPIILHVERIA